LRVCGLDAHAERQEAFSFFPCGPTQRVEKMLRTDHDNRWQSGFAYRTATAPRLDGS